MRIVKIKLKFQCFVHFEADERNQNNNNQFV